MIRPRFLVLSGLLVMLGACSQPTLSPQIPMPPEVEKWSQQVHEQLNAYRREQGLSPLAYHDGLEQLCISHSRWLCNKRGTSMISGSNVSHSGSSYRARVSRIQYGMDYWAENVAYISNTPDHLAKKLIVMWKASPAHREAMLGNWTHAGNAICVDQDGAVFATMNFGRARASAAQP